jgi:AraC family transcriptional regulator, exoenzyme S synthesis regulatory protein ExsA
MSAMDIKSCYIGPEISPEEFIPEHFFLYIAKGMINGYDGDKKHSLHAGEYCLVRKNHLARYNKQRKNNEFEKVVIIFDEAFLKKFGEKYKIAKAEFESAEAFIHLDQDELIPNFIHSLIPYYTGFGKIDPAFADIKREELLVILLQLKPGLAGLFFNYDEPEKINLKEFMNRNYKFNVGIGRFAYLTGRSLSGFKRDFREIFNDTPNHWLVQRRLQEAHFLIDKKNKKPSEIYVDLGFEDLSHFSFAFKKRFGLTPTELTEQNKNP